MLPSPSVPQTKRLLARIIKASGRHEIIDIENHKIRRDYQFARMLWEAVTEGHIVFADGRKIVVEDSKEWSDIAKIILNHIDGPVTIEKGAINVNLFKVYAGIDVDQV